MSYMDHWADNDPVPTVEKKFRVRLRVVGAEGFISVYVEAVNWQDAHNKAEAYVSRNLRIDQCLSGGNLK